MNLSKKHIKLFLNIQFLIVTILALGSVAAISIIQHPTRTQQHASSDINLNTGHEIKSDSNTNSMRAKTSEQNFSRELPGEYLGNLSLKLSEKSAQKNPEYTSLKLIISKIETHLIHLFIPDGESSIANSSFIEDKNKKSNQNLSKWEILRIQGGSSPTELELGKNKTVLLGTTELAGGKYSEIRIYIDNARVKLRNGREITLSIPVGYRIIRVLRPFNIVSGQTQKITLDIDLNKSIVPTEESYTFRPVIPNITTTN